MENTEIERKWMIKKMPADLEKYDQIEMEQAYLNISPTVRIRRENDDYVLTYKGIGEGISHSEYNLPITKEAFEHMLPKADGIVIRKRRYVIPLDGKLKAELDIFNAPYEGIRIVEVEFDSVSEAESFKAPDWFGEDVSEDPRFKNARMAVDGTLRL